MMLVLRLIHSVGKWAPAVGLSLDLLDGADVGNDFPAIPWTYLIIKSFADNKYQQ